MSYKSFSSIYSKSIVGRNHVNYFKKVLNAILFFYEY